MSMGAPFGWLSPFRSCPAPWKLTRAAAQGPDWKTARHLAACARCAAEVDAQRALIARAADLPTAELPAGSHDSIAARLVASAAARPAPSPQPRARLHVAAAGGLLVAAVGLVVTEHPWRATPDRHAPAPIPAPVATATIRPSADARFVRRQGPPDEIVELGGGTLDVEVSPLAPGARFRVVASAGDEVEVRGTSFRVAARAGRLDEVHVWRGHVEVRAAGAGVTRLGPGEAWAAAPAVAVATPDAPPAAIAESAVAERPRPRGRAHEGSDRRVVPAGPPAEAPPPSGAPSFHQAWSLLRSGDAVAAAEAFAEVQHASQGTSLESDALYWRAVALARAGERLAARDLFALYGTRFPTSSRSGEAALALGDLLADLGQAGEARQAYARAAQDLSDRVRAGARRGLARLGR